MKTFVEVGCCYFNTLRPLCDKGWKGIMIDPVKIALEKIENHPNLIKLACAIDKEIGIATLTKLKDEYYKNPEYQDYAGMSSIHPQNVLKNEIYYPEWLEEIQVSTIPLSQVLSMLHIDTIDYLKIDTEGKDLDVLYSIDFSKCDIKVIRVESWHLGDEIFVDFFEKNNYFIEQFERDIVAIKI